MYCSRACQTGPEPSPRREYMREYMREYRKRNPQPPGSRAQTARPLLTMPPDGLPVRSPWWTPDDADDRAQDEALARLEAEARRRK